MRHILFLLAFLPACGGEVAYYDTGVETYPIEDWSCEHRESQFSAHVSAETTDLDHWERIEFFIHDHDSSHSLEMQLGKDDTWRTYGSLYDLDCNSDNLGAIFVYYEE